VIFLNSDKSGGSPSSPIASVSTQMHCFLRLLPVYFFFNSCHSLFFDLLDNFSMGMTQSRQFVNVSLVFGTQMTQQLLANSLLA
jgi:hypothetical protein